MSPTPITRETFIDPSHLKTVLTQDTMYVLTEDEEGVEEVPIPESFRKVGIPEGYSVGALLVFPPSREESSLMLRNERTPDFVLDPATVVKTLKKQGIVTEE